MAALIVSGVAGVLLAAAPPAPEPWKKLSEREVRYLEMELAQIRKLQSHFNWIGRQPLASGALASAALASLGRPDAPRLRAEAARWTEGVLNACPKWHTNECGRAQLPLQRLVLQYPQTLPSELLARLRQAVSNAAPPPGEGQIQNPWSFADTENQRMITMARSLVAQRVAGTPDSPAARSWGAFAEAFLRAHDRDGWYEAESPGYLALSVTGLLQLADHAPQDSVRDLARRQLDVLFAIWAQNQVGGFPAGAKSRTNSVWALTPRSSPWQAWTWLVAGIGNPDDVNFMDRPELPVSRYRIPDGAVRLLTERRKQPPYEIRERRRIEPARRKSVNTALYAWATPDYILGAAQSVDDLALRISGGQEIVATLYAESPEFAPLYLWSRTKMPKGGAEADLDTRDQAVASRNLLVARLDTPGQGMGHAYLAPPWSKPERMATWQRGGVAVWRHLRGPGHPGRLGGGPGHGAVPGPLWRCQEAAAGNSRLLGGGAQGAAGERGTPGGTAGRGRRLRSLEEEGRNRAARPDGEGEIRFTAGGGARLDFLPGRRARVEGKTLEVSAWPRLSAPFLSSPAPGRWSFSFGDARFRFEPKGK